MCGRTYASSSAARLEKTAKSISSHVHGAHVHMVPNLDIPFEQCVSPGGKLPVLRMVDSCAAPSSSSVKSEPSLEVQTMTWGLVPHFTKPSSRPPNHYSMFNCRSESSKIFALSLSCTFPTLSTCQAQPFFPSIIKPHHSAREAFLSKPTEKKSMCGIL